MGILEIAGLAIILYPFVGYGLGKITYCEFQNNTPSEKLSVWKKAKRLLLFPATFHFWESNCEDRFSSIYNNVIPSFLGRREQEYLGCTVFLWPCKLVPAVVGVAEMLFFSTCALTLTAVDFAGKGSKCLEKTGRKLFSSATDLPSEINEIETFLENLEKRKNSLISEGQLLAKRISQLEENLTDWKNGLLPENSGEVSNIVSGLIREITANRQKLEETEKNIGILGQAELELKDALRTLARCKRTIELNVRIASESGSNLIKKDSVASLANESISAAKSRMVECQLLF